MHPHFYDFTLPIDYEHGWIESEQITNSIERPIQSFDDVSEGEEVIYKEKGRLYHAIVTTGGEDSIKIRIEDPESKQNGKDFEVTDEDKIYLAPSFDGSYLLEEDEDTEYPKIIIYHLIVSSIITLFMNHVSHQDWHYASKEDKYWIKKKEGRWFPLWGDPNIQSYHHETSSERSPMAIRTFGFCHKILLKTLEWSTSDLHFPLDLTPQHSILIDRSQAWKDFSEKSFWTEFKDPLKYKKKYVLFNKLKGTLLDELAKEEPLPLPLT